MNISLGPGMSISDVTILNPILESYFKGRRMRGLQHALCDPDYHKKDKSKKRNAVSGP
jgi:hypothetical protein